MPIREYKCPDCGLLNEHILYGEPPETQICKRCKGAAALKRIPSSISLARSGMDNAPLDNFIGKDAETKWELLRSRQGQRDAVRVETQSQGLTAAAIGSTGPENYKPITGQQKALRTEVTASIAAKGYGQTDTIPGRKAAAKP